MSKLHELTQSAIVDEVVSGDAVKEGDTIDLGKLKITSLTLNSNGTPLDDEGENPDYELEAESGLVRFLKPFPEFSGTFSADAIVSGDGMKKIKVMSETQGILGHVMIVTRQKKGGQRVKGLWKVRLFPDGDALFHQEGTDRQTYQVRFQVIQDTTKPADEQFGTIWQISA